MKKYKVQVRVWQCLKVGQDPRKGKDDPHAARVKLLLARSVAPGLQRIPSGVAHATISGTAGNHLVFYCITKISTILFSARCKVSSHVLVVQSTRQRFSTGRPVTKIFLAATPLLRRSQTLPLMLVSPIFFAQSLISVKLRKQQKTVPN